MTRWVEALRGALAILLTVCWLLAPVQARGTAQVDAPMVLLVHQEIDGAVTLSWSSAPGATYTLTRVVNGEAGVVIYTGEGTLAHDAIETSNGYVTYVLAGFSHNVHLGSIISTTPVGNDCLAVSMTGFSLSAGECLSHLPEL